MDTATIRDVLEERRSALEAELRELTAVPRDPAAAVSFGKRIGDGTTEAVDRLNKVGAADQLDAMRADVGRALVKLDDGTYGLCGRCGGPLPHQRLAARAWFVR